jgi:outer membrane lipoprotein LolB
MGTFPTLMSAPARLPLPALFVFAVFTFAGCARQPVYLPQPDRAALWETHRARLATLQGWQFRGRIAVKLKQDAWSATLYWRETRDTYTLRVVAPLGRGTFELSGSAAGVELHTADNRILRAADAEALLRDNLGWQLPVSGLRWWVRGLPHPGAGTDHLGINASGMLDDLNQDGWRVEYQEYRPGGEPVLPGRLSLENGEVRVRLVISEWTTAS